MAEDQTSERSGDKANREGAESGKSTSKRVYIGEEQSVEDQRC
jgi:hypothetical protein